MCSGFSHQYNKNQDSDYSLHYRPYSKKRHNFLPDLKNMIETKQRRHDCGNKANTKRTNDATHDSRVAGEVTIAQKVEGGGALDSVHDIAHRNLVWSDSLQRRSVAPARDALRVTESGKGRFALRT